jgi:type II secretory pathway component PulM
VRRIVVLAIGFVVGMFVGAAVGVLVMAWVAADASEKAHREAFDRSLEQQRALAAVVKKSGEQVLQPSQPSTAPRNSKTHVTRTRMIPASVVRRE